MKISACTIVKNEENNIVRWLANMQEIVDEIIVVDTGSTDRTVQILHGAGVKPYHFAWCNDFAAAKNYAIQQATGDWIVFLDADEYFDEASLHCFRQEMAKYHRNKKIGAIMCQLVNIDLDKHNKIIGTILQVRIFRNAKDIYYKNAVHEQLVAKPGKYIMQKCFSLQIMHTGYSTSIVKSKVERNLPILKERAKAAKTQQEIEQLNIFFMDAYHTLGFFDKVLEYAHKIVDSDTKILGGAIHPYECMITAMSHLGKSDDEIMAFIKEGMIKFPHEMFFPIQLAYYYLESKDFLQSESYALKSLQLRKQQKINLRAGKELTDTSLRFMPILYAILAKLSMLKGKKQQALDYALEGIHYHKYSQLLVQTLYRLLRDRDTKEIIQIFDCLYDRHKDGKFLLETLNWQVDERFAAYYAAQENYEDRVKLYLKLKKYNGALAESSNALFMLQHTALAMLCTQGEACQQEYTEIISVMPDKYREIAKNINQYKQDADARAAMRLIQEMEHKKE